jgi:O-acetyl-ADP-ribose deacetylase (regulator of RNase III)
MIEALIGDLFESRAQTLVNAVNCVGVMGKGVALEFKRRFPAMFKDYASRCRQKEVRLGEPYLYRDDETGRLIVNFPTKDHWRSPSRLQDIAAGLDYFVAHVSDWGISSVAMPALGCGHGGLEWSQVGPFMYRKLHELPMNIEVYVPYGTPEHAVTTEFLAARSK